MIRDYMAEEHVDENNIDALNSLRNSIVNGSQSGTSNQKHFRRSQNINDQNSSAPQTQQNSPKGTYDHITETYDSNTVVDNQKQVEFNFDPNQTSMLQKLDTIGEIQ